MPRRGTKRREGGRSTRNASVESSPSAPIPAYRHAPREEIREHAADHAPGHSADRRAADVQAHRKTEAFGLDLLGEIRHRDRRHAAQREPFERAHDEQPCQLGRNAAMIVSTDDAESESVISRWRLHPSETNPATKIAIASDAVDTDTASALCAGLTPNVEELRQQRLHT